MIWKADDYRFMARAIQLAGRASFHVHPNPRVGCVMVKDGNIVGEGWHVRSGEAHAEINALDQACDPVQGSDCYVTLEPCCHQGKTPPCTSALIEAGIRRVILASPDPNPEVGGQGMAQLQSAGIEVLTGLMQDRAEALNPGFMKRMRKGRPYVRCKMAMSLDGRTALANGNSRWISSKPSRVDVHGMRARSSAILTGINTVLADDPSLTVRHVDSDGYQPLRIVMDTSLRMPVDARMLRQPGETIIVTLSTDAGKRKALQDAGARIVTGTEENGHIAADKLLDVLASELSINDVLVETGPTLAGRLLGDNLVDEMILYTAPRLLGDSARGVFTLPVYDRVEDSPQLMIEDITTIGPDVRIRARVQG